MNDALLLECLIACGVDNWAGYDEAIALYHEREAEMESYNDVELRD